MTKATRALAALEKNKNKFGGARAEHKLALLGVLDRARLATARQVERLHEALCFLRAYPDDARVASQVERMLQRFARRADLRPHRDAFADTGIAGTTIRYRFFWPTARWLAHRWPAQFRLDRSDGEAEENIAGALPLLVTPAEAQWLRERTPAGYAALDVLRGRATDAAFLVRAIESMPGDSFTRESLYDGLDPSCELAPGPGTPSRTLARHVEAPAVFRTGPLRRDRPGLREEIRRAPRDVRVLGRAEGLGMVELARGAMITRKRDLDAFAYGDARDVRIVDDGDGLAFALIGVAPERRTLLPAVYGALTLQNGVPVGYSQLDVIGGTAAVSFNTFPTFRGGEAAHAFARLLALARHLFGAASYSIEPYQLGLGNEEGIASGAWWFYCKMGFRPRAAPARRMARVEIARMQANPRHRSSPATLRKLAGWHMFFDVDPGRGRGLPPVAALGERAAALLARQAGDDRSAALDQASRALMRLTGLRSLQGFTPGERLAWRRWSPFVLALPGVSRWNTVERRALARVVRAKGGRRESDFATLFDAHPGLGPALFAMR
ncbi:MAG TPA: hypothetical protein VLD36_15505 [Burkholderiales bacterium]|nr:hypothetical protein [Burkholderiales bacterium]